MGDISEAINRSFVSGLEDALKIIELHPEREEAISTLKQWIAQLKETA